MASLVCVLLFTLAISVSSMTSLTSESSWLTEKNRLVTSYVSVTSARSRIDCVIKCSESPHCTSCAFDVISSECFHQSDTASSGGGSVLTSWTKLGFTCNVSDVPINKNTSSVTWHTLPTDAMEGAIHCLDPDFMYSGNDPTIRCLDTGQWATDAGVCKQHFFRNPQKGVFYELPRSPISNWTMCAEGYPVKPSYDTDNRFSFNLFGGNGDYYVHFDVRFKYKNKENLTVITSSTGGHWMHEFRIFDPFPFAYGDTFLIHMQTKTSYVLEISLNQQFFANYTSPKSLEDVTQANFLSYAHVNWLDLWCF